MYPVGSYLEIVNSSKLWDLANKIKRLSTSLANRKKHENFKILNGNAFFPIHTWPLSLQIIMWDSPISDTNTFKLLLFWYGNAAPPELTIEFLLLSQVMDHKKLTKRAFQIKWIINNLKKHEHRWYFWDISLNSQIFLNGNQTSHSQHSHHVPSPFH